MKKVKDKINNNNSSAKISAPVKTSKVKPKSKVKNENKSNVIDFLQFLRIKCFTCLKVSGDSEIPAG